jgi:hypothetical protein
LADVRQLVSKSNHLDALDDPSRRNFLKTFFGPEGFIKRLQLHMMHICKSKTKQQTTLSLYFAQLRESDKQLNMLEYVPTEGNAEAQFDKKSARKVLAVHAEIEKKKA